MSKIIQLYSDKQRKIKAYPKTIASSVYMEDGKTTVKEQLDNKANLSDVAKISSGTPLFASNVSGMTDTTKNYVNTTDGFLYTYNGTTFAKSTVQYQSTGIDDYSITQRKMATPYVEGTIGKNKFDKNNIIRDKAILNGVVVDSVGNSIGKVNIEPNEKYIISGAVWIDPYSIFDISNNHISSYAGGYENKITTPSNGSYIVFTVNSTLVNAFQVEKGDVITRYEDFIYEINNKSISKNNAHFIKGLLKNNVITVGVSGCDFVNLRQALESIKYSSENNQYDVLIKSGRYELTDLYTKAEIENPTFIGLVKPNYVNLIGEDNTILSCVLDNTYSQDTRNRVSTLCTYGNGRLENLIVACSGGRYAVHDDYNYFGIKRECFNCKFIKDSGGYAQAYGSGLWSGDYHYFENCYFYSELGNAYSFHNNFNFTKKAKVKMVGCKAETTVNAESMRFGYLKSNTVEEIELIGCEVKNGIFVMNEDYVEVPNSIKFKIKGYANDNFTFRTMSGFVATNTNGFIKTV